ncbi:hypothetical protein ACV3UL_08905 [Clostridium perfringens]
MKKIKRGSLIIDIAIALMFISIIIFSCYNLATTAINKRYQISQERDALIIAENIMNRVLSQGTYTIQSEPQINAQDMAKIEAINSNPNMNQSEKNKALLDIGGRLPINVQLDAPFLPSNNNYSYQVIAEHYVDPETGAKNLSMKKITVNVFYPTKVAMFKNNKSDQDKDFSKETSRDKISLEEDYRVVTLTTFKSAREYEFI